MFHNFLLKGVLLALRTLNNLIQIKYDKQNARTKHVFGEKNK